MGSSRAVDGADDGAGFGVVAGAVAGAVARDMDAEVIVGTAEIQVGGGMVLAHDIPHVNKDACVLIGVCRHEHHDVDGTVAALLGILEGEERVHDLLAHCGERTVAAGVDDVAENAGDVGCGNCLPDICVWGCVVHQDSFY